MLAREEEAPIIDVLTFGSGDSPFEKFGHTALCIRYHDPNLSPVCFNYGVTDFDPTKPIAYRWRAQDFGNRVIENVDENSRLLAGLEGDIGAYSYKLGASIAGASPTASCARRRSRRARR